MMKKALPALLLVLALPLKAAEAFTVTTSDWAQPRSGEALLHHPALAQAVEQLQAHSASVLEVRYPGGDSGSLWARELQAWLVALGVESARIRLVPGSESADQLQLRVH